jgi:hypothetical protein
MAQVSTLISCDAAVFTRGLWSFVNVFEELSFAKFPASHPAAMPPSSTKATTPSAAPIQ